MWVIQISRIVIQKNFLFQLEMSMNSPSDLVIHFNFGVTLALCLFMISAWWMAASHSYDQKEITKPENQKFERARKESIGSSS